MQGPTLIHRLVGMAVRTEVARCICAGVGKVTGEEAKRFLEELRGLPPVPELAEVIDKSERLAGLSELSALAKYGTAWASGHSGGGVPPVGGVLGDGVLPVNFEQYMRDTNHLWNMTVSAFRMKTCVGMKNALAAAEKEQTRLSGSSGLRVGVAASVASLLTTMMAIPSKSLAFLEQESRIRFQLAELGLVLAMDREARGGYARSLADVAAAERAGLDQDFFSGGMLVYRREGKGYVLYSVGPNGVDDGGMWRRMKFDMPVLPEPVKKVVVDKYWENVAK